MTLLSLPVSSAVPCPDSLGGQAEADHACESKAPKPDTVVEAVGGRDEVALFPSPTSQPVWLLFQSGDPILLGRRLAVEEFRRDPCLWYLREGLRELLGGRDSGLK
jgi:hypothetical protein